MNKRFRISPGAPSLVLIVVVLSMSIMGMLMYIRTQNDIRLSARSLAVAQADAALTEQAEKDYAQLDALALRCRESTKNDAAYLLMVEENLPENMEMDGRVIAWQVMGQGRQLSAEVMLNPYEEDVRIVWYSRMINAEVGNTWNEY